ncbi:MAG: rod shape-determining protein MreC [Candidatus Hydrogenedentes bacterium]|nr:rod shape-determining protein MreC [Candidatus Hydrogenedentota bacterium]
MFSLTRRLSEHRSTVILILLAALSVVSLASGTRGSLISGGLRTVVSVIAYPFWKTFASVPQGADYLAGLVISYDAARREAEALRRELPTLMLHSAQRAELQAQNTRLKQLLEFKNSTSRLDLQPANVLEPIHVLARPQGTLIVDQGSLHGVRPSMCVINDLGLIGVVTQVQPTLSYVYTLHNPECKIGAMIKRNRVRGIVHGSGSEFSQICTIQYIDLKDDVRPGDEVVSSGGSVFPSGYPIGRIVHVPESDSLLKMAYVEPAADPYRLDEVFLVRQAATAPEEMSNTDPTGSEEAVATEMLPDTRSLQERYAP